MSTIIHKSWPEVRKQIDDLVSELQDWREHAESGVLGDSYFTDALTDAIDANLALMPLVVPDNY